MAYPDPRAPSFRRVVPSQLANQGETTGRVRTVLHLSLGLAVLAGVVLGAVFFW